MGMWGCWVLGELIQRLDARTHHTKNQNFAQNLGALAANFDLKIWGAQDQNFVAYANAISGRRQEPVI